MESKEDVSDTTPSSTMLASARKMPLARVLLDLLAVIIEKDSDQRFVDLYNELKPRCERKLRKRGPNL